MHQNHAKGFCSRYDWSREPCAIIIIVIIIKISFAKFDEHSTPLFAKLKIIKLHDIILLYTACFMYQYSNCNIPSAFDSFFTAINTTHNYGTRLASKSTFAFPKIRTNYGKFNIRYFGPKIWNEIEEQLKTLSFRCFKRELKERFSG